MARKLKVWGIYLTHPVYRRQVRATVAASSQRRAAEILGVSLNELRTYGCETCNDAELAWAKMYPECAIWAPR